VKRSDLQTAEIIASGVLVGLGVYVVMQARQWTYSGPEGPGPGFFPIWYGIGIIGLALLLIAKNLLGRTEGERPKWTGTVRSLAVWLVLAITVALMQVIGFFLGLALLTFFICFVMYRRRVIVALIASAAVAAGFLIFPLALGVSLPTGIWGI
jgi:putative tricarboxylic transport membrane protein